MSPSASGAWALTEFQSKAFLKFKGKYWDVSQGVNVRARGRIGGDGKMTGLPDSVTLLNSQGNAELRVRCSPVCGDPDYYGEVIATNAGIDGPWDISFLSTEITSRSVWGGYWAIRIDCTGGVRLGWWGKISASGELLKLPSSPLDLGLLYHPDNTHWHYAEVIAVCRANGLGEPIIPTQLNRPVEAFYDEGPIRDMYPKYNGVVGAFQPGVNVSVNLELTQGTPENCLCRLGGDKPPPAGFYDDRLCVMGQCSDSVGRMYFMHGIKTGERFNVTRLEECGDVKAVVRVYER